jgi:hypothetical protein
VTAQATAPGLSVILYAADSLATVATTLSHLRAQTARDRIELALVGPASVCGGFDPGGGADFAAVRIVEVAPGADAPVARAAAVRAAAAPIVALVEDHSFPEPEWAAALLAAHEGPWAAVGPVIGNANPATALSWANLFINYGPWVPPRPAGVARDLPGHNSSYKRARLLAYGAHLERAMERETLLHADLCTRGDQLYLEPRARTNHVNVSRWTSTVVDQYYGGRVFAGTRAAAGWPVGRRVRHAARTPVRTAGWLAAILRAQTGVDRGAPAWGRVLPGVVVGLGARAVGELVGYLAGPGRAAEALADFEFHRDRHLSARDRATSDRV